RPRRLTGKTSSATGVQAPCRARLQDSARDPLRERSAAGPCFGAGSHPGQSTTPEPCPGAEAVLAIDRLLGRQPVSPTIPSRLRRSTVLPPTSLAPGRRTSVMLPQWYPSSRRRAL